MHHRLAIHLVSGGVGLAIYRPPPLRAEHPVLRQRLRGHAYAARALTFS